MESSPKVPISDTRPHCTSTSECWSSDFRFPDFSPKTPIYMTTFAPKGYTHQQSPYNPCPIPYSLFAPTNIDLLYHIAFSDAILVYEQKYFYYVPVFFCEELHTWFFPPFDTGLYLTFSKVTGALIKARTLTEEWLFDRGVQPVSIRRI